MGVLFCTIVKLFSWSVPRLMFFSSSFKSSSCRQPVAAVKFCFVGVRSTQSANRHPPLFYGWVMYRLNYIFVENYIV